MVVWRQCPHHGPRVSGQCPACSDQPQPDQAREGLRWQDAGCDLTAAAVQNQDQAPLLFSFCKPEQVCSFQSPHSREATSHVWLHSYVSRGRWWWACHIAAVHCAREPVRRWWLWRTGDSTTHHTWSPCAFCSDGVGNWWDLATLIFQWYNPQSPSWWVIRVLISESFPNQTFPVVTFPVVLTHVLSCTVWSCMEYVPSLSPHLDMHSTA